MLLCLFHCPWPPSAITLPPPPPPRFVGFLVFDWRRCGGVWRQSHSTHSRADLGVVLRISFAVGPISPFTNSAQRGGGEKEREKNYKNSPFLFAPSPHFFCASSYTLWSLGFRAESCVLLVWRRRQGLSGQILLGKRKEALRSLFIHFIGSFVGPKKHGSTNLQNRREGGSCGGKGRRRRGCGCQDKRTGKYYLITLKELHLSRRILCFYATMCCFNGVLHPSMFTGIQGKWPHEESPLLQMHLYKNTLIPAKRTNIVMIFNRWILIHHFKSRRVRSNAICFFPPKTFF